MGRRCSPSALDAQGQVFIKVVRSELQMRHFQAGPAPISLPAVPRCASPHSLKSSGGVVAGHAASGQGYATVPVKFALTDSKQPIRHLAAILAANVAGYSLHWLRLSARRTPELDGKLSAKCSTMPQIALFTGPSIASKWILKPPAKEMERPRQKHSPACYVQSHAIQTLLKDFSGVLVSDFYAAYDAINCPTEMPDPFHPRFERSAFKTTLRRRSQATGR